jgi:hypothetical protein
LVNRVRLHHRAATSSLLQSTDIEAAARKSLRTYAERFNGNLTEILGAYNQGSGAGNVFGRSGDNPATLKPVGQKYIRGSQGVHVTIENAAGSSFVTQNNMNAVGFPGY